ncbi:esterase [Oryctes borbonicus]|uniref:Esterase n=1 Tax=Oryctes borbonicus TaxID=1629725 RepID=A0A0T6BDJ7_9SCAR|nr:esterase [Oryctes borbonicus]
MLMGYNSMEGVDFPLQVAFSTYFTITQLASEGLVPKSFNITDPVLLKEVGDVLKAYYFGDLSAVTFTDYQAIPYIGDLYFVIDAIQTAQIASRFTKVFFYVFSFMSQLGNPLRPYNLGVGHAEDVNYLFTRISSPPILSDAEQETRLRMIRLWTNFAKTGNPTPNNDPLLQNVRWPMIDENLNYLDIGDDLVPKVNPREAEYNLWMALYAAYKN